MAKSPSAPFTKRMASFSFSESTTSLEESKLNTALRVALCCLALSIGGRICASQFQISSAAASKSTTVVSLAGKCLSRLRTRLEDALEKRGLAFLPMIGIPTDGGLASLMIALYLTQDSFGTAANVSGDNAIAAVVDHLNKKWSKKVDNKTA